MNPTRTSPHVGVLLMLLGCTIAHAEAPQKAPLLRKPAVSPAKRTMTPRERDQATELISRGVDLVKTDPATSMAHFERACALGHQQGCYNVAVFLAGDVRAFPPDYARAEKLYRQACAEGNSSACNNLGKLVSRGHAGRPDQALAFSFYLRACQLGDVQGCANAGNRLRMGWGVPEDFVMARALLDFACLADQCDACGGIAMMKMYAQSFDRDVPAGLHTLKLECFQHHDVLSCIWLGSVLGDGTGVTETDMVQAEQAWNEGCELNMSACGSLGNLWSGPAAPAETRARGRALLLEAVRVGDAGAKTSLAKRGYDLLTAFPADREVMTALEGVCREGNDSAACEVLAAAYQGRYGVDADHARSEEFKSLAATGDTRNPTEAEKAVEGP